MPLVQIWENEKDMALQHYIYQHTGHFIIVAFGFIICAILYEINIY